MSTTDETSSEIHFDAWQGTATLVYSAITGIFAGYSFFLLITALGGSMLMGTNSRSSLFMLPLAVLWTLGPIAIFYMTSRTVYGFLYPRLADKETAAGAFFRSVLGNLVAIAVIVVIGLLLIILSQGLL